jgi:hypothetical protein
MRKEKLPSPCDRCVYVQELRVWKGETVIKHKCKFYGVIDPLADGKRCSDFF